MGDRRGPRDALSLPSGEACADSRFERTGTIFPGFPARGALILDNTITGNEGAALLVTTGGYGRNVIEASTVLHAASTAVQVDTNVCNGSATCP